MADYTNYDFYNTTPATIDPGVTGWTRAGDSGWYYNLDTKRWAAPGTHVTSPYSGMDESERAAYSAAAPNGVLVPQGITGTETGWGTEAPNLIEKGYESSQNFLEKALETVMPMIPYVQGGALMAPLGAAVGGAMGATGSATGNAVTGAILGGAHGGVEGNGIQDILTQAGLGAVGGYASGTLSDYLGINGTASPSGISGGTEDGGLFGELYGTSVESGGLGLGDGGYDFFNPPLSDVSENYGTSLSDIMGYGQPAATEVGAATLGSTVGAGTEPFVADAGLGLTGAGAGTGLAAAGGAGLAAGAGSTLGSTLGSVAGTALGAAGLLGASYLSGEASADAQSEAIDKLIAASKTATDESRAWWSANAYPKADVIEAAKKNQLAAMNQASQTSQKNFLDSTSSRGIRGGGILSSGLADIERGRQRDYGTMLNNLTQFANTPLFAPNMAPYSVPSTASTTTGESSLYSALSSLLGTTTGASLYKSLYGTS
jgi:hypothetical protein